MHSVTPSQDKKPKLLPRLTTFLQRIKSTISKQSLPEEEGEEETQREWKRQAAARHNSAFPTKRFQLPRIHTSPIPINIPTDYTLPSLLNPALTTSLAREASLAFLTPLESSILTTILSSKRCARFRPILSPATELLLVQPSDVAPFQIVQEQVKDLPDDEKTLLERDLRPYLLQQQRYVLGILVWSPRIVVTSQLEVGKREVKEGFERPTSEEMFGPWKREWGNEVQGGEGFRTFGVVVVDDEE